MARGWESKAVADQIEEGESRQHDARKPAVTPEQRMLIEQLDSLNCPGQDCFNNSNTPDIPHIATFCSTA